MARHSIAIAVIVGLVSPCVAGSYRLLLLPELVGRADAIVIGKVTKIDEEAYHVKVTATLAGRVGEEVTFHRWFDTMFDVGERQIFFLVTRKKGLSLIYPFSCEEPTRAAEVRRLVDMKTVPKKYLDDPKQSGTPDFLEILGYAFAGRDSIGRLTKADAVEHLRRCLMSDDKKAVLQALAGLQRTGSKQTVLSVIPLLHHPNPSVRLATIKFLEWSSDKRSVGPLCRALDEVQKDRELTGFIGEAKTIDGVRKEGELGGFIGRALGHLQDPAAVPALKRAVKRGIDGWTGWALGTLGDSSCFEVLLEGAEKYDSTDAAGGLQVLVHRSNKKPEPWMNEIGWSEKTGLEHKDKWRKWWNANKADFKVIRTADEAFGPHK